MEAKMTSFKLKGESATLEAALDCDNHPYYTLCIGTAQVYTGDLLGLEALLGGLFNDMYDFGGAVQIGINQHEMMGREVQTFEALWGE